MPTRKKTNVVLLFGGISTEHEISIMSARSVYQAIDKEKYNVSCLGIDKSGRFVPNNLALPVLQHSQLLLSSKKEDAIASLQHDDKSKTVFFPILHGPNGEDGTIQGMLEILNVPYVGAGVTGSAIGMDKTKQKEILAAHNFLIVPYLEIDPQKYRVRDIEKLGYPVFIKPVNAGSSVGVNKAHNRRELSKFVREAAKYDQYIIVEKGVENIREVEVAVLGNNNPQASICGEIVPGHEFYDYAAKYESDKTELLIPAGISKKTARQVRKMAVSAFKILRGGGMARADFFVEKKTERIWFNEVNTIPGFTKVSMYPRLWTASGLEYPSLIERLITLALGQWKRKQEMELAVTS